VQVFSDGERSGLLSDVMNLVRARLLSYHTALDLTTYLQRCDQSGHRRIGRYRRSKREIARHP